MQVSVSTIFTISGGTCTQTYSLRKNQTSLSGDWTDSRITYSAGNLVFLTDQTYSGLVAYLFLTETDSLGATKSYYAAITVDVCALPTVSSTTATPSYVLSQRTG